MATRREVELLLLLRDEASKRLKTIDSNVGLLTKGFGVLAAAVGAAAVTIGVGLYKASGDAQELADTLDNLSKQTGLSYDFLQDLKNAAKEAGVSLEVSAKGAIAFQKAIFAGTKEAKDAIAALGLSFVELKKQTPEEGFKLILDRLAQMPPGFDRAGAASSLFGKSAGAAIIQMAGDFQETSRALDELNVRLSKDAIEASAALEDQFSKLGTATAGFWQQLGAAVNQSGALQELIPKLTKVVSDLNKWIVENTDNIKRWVDTGIFYLLHAISAALQLFGRWSIAATSLNIALLGVVKTILEYSTVLAKFIPGLSNLRTGTLAAVDATIAIQEAIKAAGEAALSGAANVDDMIESIVNSAGSAHDAAASVGEFTGAITESEESAKKAKKAFEELLKKGVELGGIRNFGLEKFIPGVRNTGSPLGFAEDDKHLVSIVQNLGKSNESLVEFSETQADVVKAVEAMGDGLSAGAKEAKTFEESLAAAADFAKVINSTFGSIVSQIVVASAGLKKLLEFDFGKAFSGGLSGILGGVASFLPIAGAIAGPVIEGIKAIFSSGRGVGTIIEEAARDLGQTWSESFVKSAGIEIGTNLQLQLAKAFQAGGFGGDVNRFAEEVGDIFSGLEQGLFSTQDAIAALQRDLPILIDNFDKLGPEGQAQIERIIAAAERLGVELPELTELSQILGASFKIAADHAIDAFVDMGGSFHSITERMKNDSVDAAKFLERLARILSKIQRGGELGDIQRRFIDRAGGLPGVPSFQHGGFVDRPTLAVIGDRPGGEYVVGADQMRGLTVNVHFNGPIADREVFRRIAIEAVTDAIDQTKNYGGAHSTFRKEFF